MTHHRSTHLAKKIMYAMLVGLIFGLILNYAPTYEHINVYLIEGLLLIGGKIFISLMTMLVVPLVFVSLVCGASNMGSGSNLGRIGLKTLSLYIFTTALAITLGLIFANLFHIGVGSNLVSDTHHVIIEKAPPLVDTLISIVPTNPLASMMKGDMLQVIVFSLLFGIAMAKVGKPASHVTVLFEETNHILIRLIHMMMEFAPIGVFCLVTNLFAKMGISLISQLLSYFMTMLFVLLLHCFISNSLLLTLLAKLNPLVFFKKLYPAMIFAFSTSSSNASIPVVLDTVENKLGVKNNIASFIVPLGATVNMDGTAIMQGIATVFIAHAYNIDISLVGYLTVVLTATLSSIGTAGVPGVGMVTLIMVLQQVGLPTEGITLIIGIDRFLDMVRTAVNITGDAAVACIVGKSEDAFNPNIFNDPDAE